ncbi:MAG: DUF6261 family protein [Bacteroidales bacterium]|nr:DUF6261 family protein [Bacteroidales bacterium]
MINQIKSRANTNELSGASSMIADHAKNSAYPDEKLSKFGGKLESGNTELIKAQKRKRKNDETDAVRDLENKRDDSFKAFSYGTKSATLRADKTIAVDASLIYEVIKRHGVTLYNLADMEQTAVTNSLISELDKPAYQTALKNAGLDASYAEMKERHQTYVLADENKTKSAAEKEVNELVAVAYKKTKTALSHLINYINAINYIEESAELKTLSNSIATVTDKTNAKIRARLNRGKSNGESEEEEEGEE